MAQNPPLTLYTIGHSDRSADEFLDHLKQHGVTVGGFFHSFAARRGAFGWRWTI